MDCKGYIGLLSLPQILPCINIASNAVVCFLRHFLDVSCFQFHEEKQKTLKASQVTVPYLSCSGRVKADVAAAQTYLEKKRERKVTTSIYCIYIM